MEEFVALALLLLNISRLSASELECENKSAFNYFGHTGTESAKTCFMQIFTTIDSPGFTISTSDGTIEGLSFDRNKKIRFLPEQIAEKFPNLLFFLACGCSLTEVLKSNFESLVKLRDLQLSMNQIEKISSNTFEDLASLKTLKLCKEFLFQA